MGYVVVATMWTGAVIYTPLRELPPPPEYMEAWLDSIARRLAPANAGVKPTVRVVQSMPSLTPVVIPGGELPEDVSDPERLPGGFRLPPRRLHF
jgi:hypothetical protein